ncbi:MAG: DUF3291 domain-containing protein [Acidiferrobacterales bacterium]|nr:DUF3291 domain-containing protein [Acidiferrobacterales bacterium]
MSAYHLAQINIARAVDDLESETLKGFVDRLEEINSLADNAAGFVWRLQTVEGDATAIKAFDDPRIIVNLSVWESIESLSDFVYQSTHVELLKARREWFERMDQPSLAMWWVPVGSIPIVEEAKEKLEMIRQLGPTRDAFNFSGKFPVPT